MSFARVCCSSTDCAKSICGCPGFGHSIPALLAGPHKAQMCVGGSARLAEALVADIREHGGEVRTGVEIRAILMRNGRAAGVELATGERIEARGIRRLRTQPAADFPRSAGRRRRAARTCASAPADSSTTCSRRSSP